MNTVTLSIQSGLPQFRYTFAPRIMWLASFISSLSRIGVNAMPNVLTCIQAHELVELCLSRFVANPSKVDAGRGRGDQPSAYSSTLNDEILY